MAKKVAKKPSYEDLGKMIQNIYESGYADKNQTYKMSFLKGVLAGLGGVIGATLVLALMIWILSLLGDVPLIGRITENIVQTVEQAKEN